MKSAKLLVVTLRLLRASFNLAKQQPGPCADARARLLKVVKRNFLNAKLAQKKYE